MTQEWAFSPRTHHPLDHVEGRNITSTREGLNWSGNPYNGSKTIVAAVRITGGVSKRSLSLVAPRVSVDIEIIPPKSLFFILS